MNLRITLVASFILLLITPAFSQEYFQQDVNYKISVRLDDKKSMLYAFETIEYTNNSPQALKFLYFHLWPNAYMDNSTAFAKQQVENNDSKFYFAKDEDRGYIDSLQFKINGELVKWEHDPDNIDICKIYLNTPLKKGQKITITTPFRVKIPSSKFSRLGHSFESYQVTQWYPKPAVYDMKGWHQMPYLNQGEFYSEFGDFDITITLPADYLVAATGSLQTQEEKARIEQKIQQTREYLDTNEENTDTVKTDSMKTIHYTAENVHDFAWFADKRFDVLKSSVELPHSGRKVTTYAFFPRDYISKWKHAPSYINDALYYYSLWIGDYQHDNCTAVISDLSAGAGMEYPMITVIGETHTDLSLEEVIMHEVGHNWFYSTLASNERDYPWIDEGINTFYQMRYMYTKYPDLKLYNYFSDKAGFFTRLAGFHQLPYNSLFQLSYLASARLNADQPASLASEKYTMMNYGAVIYMKVPVVLNYLKEYLGEERFDEAMKTLYENYKFKHVYPEDIFSVFRETTGENLDIFFGDLLTTKNKVDYKVKKLRGDSLLVCNKARINAPFSVSGIKDNQVIATQWFDGLDSEKWHKLDSKFDEAEKLVLDNNSLMPEINRQNNYLKTKGLFKKVEPLKFKFAGSAERSDQSSVFYMPIGGWNNYNGFMAGALFHNGIVIQRRVEYQLMPMYGFANNEFSGAGNISGFIHPVNSAIEEITFGLSGIRYGYDLGIESGNTSAESENTQGSFNRLSAKVNFLFAKNPARSKLTKQLQLSAIYVSDVFAGYASGDNEHDMYATLAYSAVNKRKINPFSVKFNVEYQHDFAKVFGEFNYRLTYLTPIKGLNIRLFAGTYLFKNFSDETISEKVYNFTVSGSRGYQDYLYSQPFLNRDFEAVYNSYNYKDKWSHQFVKNNGGFVLYTPFNTGKWMCAINLSASLPLSKIPVNVYANIAFYNDNNDSYICKDQTIYTEKIIYETGFELALALNVVSFYFPVFASQSLTDYNDYFTANYWQKIRFTYNFNALNPFQAVKKVLR